jgi:hypothetical protein
MLRDAALLQLDLVKTVILEAMTPKESPPYNTQFVSGQPIFIVTASFETLPAVAVWSRQRQFPEMFLYPLMLQTLKSIDFQPLIREWID